MTTNVVAKILVSIAGGGATSGGVLAAFGQSVALTAQSTVGWSQALWQIYDYPPGFSAPAGWSTDASGIIFFQPSNPTTPPPSFNLPGSGANNWGKWALRLRINGNPLSINVNGVPNTNFNPAYTDESTMLCVPSPTNGMHGVSFNETTQFDPLRGAVGELMQSLRKVG